MILPAINYWCILDPKEVHGEDALGETFHMLKDRSPFVWERSASDVTSCVGGVEWARERMKAE